MFGAEDLVLHHPEVGFVSDISKKGVFRLNTKSRLYKTIELKEIELIVKNAFDRDTTIDSYKQLSGGLFNTTYFIKTLLPNKSLVLRIAPMQRHHCSGTAADYTRLARGLCLTIRFVYF